MADPDTRQANQTKPFAPASILPDPEQKRPRWIVMGLVGGIIFLCTIGFVISSIFIYRRVTSNQQTTASSSTAVFTPQLAVTAINAQPTQLTGTASREGNLVSTPTRTLPATQSQQPTLTLAPSFGPICFKPVTARGEPLDCVTTFPPNVVEVHAIFDYAGLVPNQHTWTRIWYHNGEEVLKVEEKWTGDSSGQFDYNLNTTDGQPLSPGTWELELYANDELQTYGAFVVTPADTPTPSIKPSPRPAPLSTYTLAFTKWDGGKHSIWTATLDGSNQQFLLDFAASPSWSPDGKQLAFFGEEGIDTQARVSSGTNGIWKMGAAGENPTRILPEGTAHTVTWSPDGQIIAFDGARGGPDRRVYFIDPNGAPQSFEALGEHPSFSPDGAELVVKLCRPQCGLWIENPDNTNPHQLTTEGSDGLPAWSPDGKKIAFSRNVDGNVDVYTINPDGSELQRLTTALGNDSVPAWTPDGQYIVFRSTRNGVWQIFVMNADGLDQHMVIDNVGASNEWAFDRMSVK